MAGCVTFIAAAIGALALRFVTWTLKYAECHWVRVLGLGEHYARAELDASVAEDGTVEVKEPKNVTRFALLPPVLQGEKRKLTVGGVGTSYGITAISQPPLPGQHETFGSLVVQVPFSSFAGGAAVPLRMDLSAGGFGVDPFWSAGTGPTGKSTWRSAPTAA